MVLNICFTNLWVLWEFGLYLYLGNSHVLVAMFDLVYYPGAVFMKGLSQVLGLSWLYFYAKVKPKTWLRPFVNTAPGILGLFFINKSGNWYLVQGCGSKVLTQET